MHGFAAHDPAHVRPEAAVARAVRIAGLVGELMMHAVRGHPEDRPALERQRGAGGEEILKPLGALETAMRQQAVIAESDAETAGYPVKK